MRFEKRNYLTQALSDLPRLGVLPVRGTSPSWLICSDEFSFPCLCLLPENKSEGLPCLDLSLKTSSRSKNDTKAKF